MEARQNLQGIALVGASAVIWGMGGLFTRLLPFDLWTIIFWRGVFAVPFVGLYAFWRLGRTLGREVTAVSADKLIVCVCILATITLFPAAFQSTSVAKAFMILSALPFVTAAIAWLWIGERPSALTIAASLLALLGMFIMVGPFTGGLQTGDLLAAAGTRCAGAVDRDDPPKPEDLHAADGVAGAGALRDGRPAAGPESVGALAA